MTDKLIATANTIKSWAYGEGGLFAMFDQVEKEYSEQLFATAVEDGAVRELIYHRMNALRDLRAIIQRGISRGAGQETIIRNLAKIKKVV